MSSIGKVQLKGSLLNFISPAWVAYVYNSGTVGSSITCFFLEFPSHQSGQSVSSKFREEKLSQK